MTTKKRILAAFVLAFLCLNVGGVLCLTYCSQIAMASASSASDDSHLSEHCKRAKKEAEERNKDSSRIDANEASCCMLPVVAFAAPIEERNFFSVEGHVGAVMPSGAVTFRVPGLIDSSVPATPVYRPPPLDRRAERIRNCVIRI